MIINWSFNRVFNELFHISNIYKVIFGIIMVIFISIYIGVENSEINSIYMIEISILESQVTKRLDMYS